MSKTHSLRPNPGRIRGLHQNFEIGNLVIFWPKRSTPFFLSKTHSLTPNPGRLRGLHQNLEKSKKNRRKKKFRKSAVFEAKIEPVLRYAFFEHNPLVKAISYYDTLFLNKNPLFNLQTRKNKENRAPKNSNMVLFHHFSSFFMIFQFSDIFHV